MARIDLPNIYAQARKRWPSVDWPLHAFAQHVQDAGGDPDHPIDLYLAGAAGHGLETAWSVIQDELGPDCRRTFARRATADYDDPEDLWLEVVGKLLEPDPQLDARPDGEPSPRLLRYRGQASLKSFLIKVGLRLAQSRQRTIKNRPQSVSASQSAHAEDDRDAGLEHLPDHAGTDPATEAEHRELNAALTDRLAEALAELSDEQRFLLRIVWNHEVPQKQAAGMLHWTEAKVSRHLRKAYTHLADVLKDLQPEPDQDAHRQAWAHTLQRLLAAEDPSISHP